jgi:hypothetical protein
MAEANITIDVLNMDKVKRCIEALAELVACKDISNTKGSVPYDRELLAWAAARAALAQSETQPLTDEELADCGLLSELAAPPAAPAEPVALSEFQRMQIIGDEFPIALVEPIIIQKIDAVCRAIERAVRGQT